MLYPLSYGSVVALLRLMLHSSEQSRSRTETLRCYKFEVLDGLRTVTVDESHATSLVVDERNFLRPLLLHRARRSHRAVHNLS